MDKPEIDFPDFDPPADLVITDLVEGDGAEATRRVDGAGPLRGCRALDR